MAASNEQKLKILHLLRLLWEETDAERGLTMTEIITKLAEVGVDAERKSLYRDIQALRDFGLTVDTYSTSPVQYALDKEGLGFNEVMLLVDAVQGSKFVSDHKSRQLTLVLKNLASKREQKLLDKRVHVEGRIRNQNESAFHNVDVIHQAISEKRKIQFLYCKYGTDKEQHPQQDGKLYVYTPVKVVFVNGAYYLAAWSDHREKILTFRIDRMKLVQMTDEKATRNQAISDYAYEDFEYQAFEMFDGDPVSVTLHVQSAGMDVIIDRFGREVTVTDATEEACNVHVTVRMSRLFHGWLAAMDDIIELTAPKSAVADHRQWLEERLRLV